MASVRLKVNLLVTSFIVAMTVLISIFTYQQSKELIISKETSSVSMRLENEKLYIRDYFVRITQDISFLAETKYIKLFLTNNPEALNRNQIEHLFKRFLENRKEYFQLRILDHKGMEIVRANKNKHIVTLTTQDNLQDKSKRYYFTKTAKKNPGEVYFSPIDLNIEHGKIDTPHRPTIRISMPIYSDKDFLGIVILNVDLRILFTHIEETLSHIGEIYLTNNKGDYLIHPNKNRTFRFHYNESYKLQDTHKELADIYKYRDNFNWNHKNKHILDKDNHLLYVLNIPYNYYDNNDQATLALKTNKTLIKRDINNIKYKISVIALVIIITAIFISEIFTYLITTPIINIANAAKNYLRADFDQSLPTNSNDEIAELTKSISDMVKNIHESSRDLEKHKSHLEELVDERTYEIKSSLADAAKRLETRDKFIKDISEEFDKPMNNLMRLIKSLEETELSETQKKQISDLEHSAEYLSGYVNDILNFSNFSQTMTIEKNTVSLKQTINEALNTIFYEEKRNINVNFDWDSTAHECVLADELRIKQIITNLINNAYKYTEEGDITLSVKRISTNNNLMEYRISVKDTSPGIPSDKKTNIQDNINKIANEQEYDVGDIGLGLSIAAKILHHLGTKLEVESSLGEGSNFFFTISLATVKPPKSKPAENYKGKKALIAEDSRVNLLATTNILEELGIEVTGVNNGLKAIEAFNNNDFDIIFMDCRMPDMDGYLAAETIRDTEKENDAKPTPIIALTANDARDDEDKCRAAGMNYYISKPLTKDKISTILKEYI